MNAVPVANQREDEQQSGNQQQTYRFGRIDRMAMVGVRTILALRWFVRGRHADIVALRMVP
jgi:hypothetical protein